MNYKKNNPIDVVIAWVDGSDNFLIKKRKNYLKSNLMKFHLEHNQLDLVV